ncbi:tyrosine-type recombinase/integrase [Delftia sp. PS-11]|uniref:tyrosine-type recombinase/integrase n=1 Tax=Delftia sp. PS-11 TaxID=2767222 RepID=UPI003AB2FE07
MNPKNFKTDQRLTGCSGRTRYCHAHTNVEIYSIVSFALETAMRQSEILNLRWENVNLSSRIASLPETKNGTKRDVPLSLHARDMLTRLTPKSSGRIFSYTANSLKST